MQHKSTVELEKAIEAERSTRPLWAEFVSLSFAAELEAGVRESVAATKWIGKITGRDQA